VAGSSYDGRVIRIVAGRWASRPLASPRGQSTRPTSDRVREAVFAHMAARLGRAGGAAGDQLAGLRFLDLFAGSGAVGLEAASRGAAWVTWVERDAATAGVVEQNRRLLGARGRVVRSSVEAFLAGRAPAHGGAYDLIWFDPPYSWSSQDLDRLLGLAGGSGWLAGDGLVLVERSARAAPPAGPGWADAWRRDYGDTCVFVSGPGIWHGAEPDHQRDQPSPVGPGTAGGEPAGDAGPTLPGRSAPERGSAATLPRTDRLS